MCTELLTLRIVNIVGLSCWIPRSSRVVQTAVQILAGIDMSAGYFFFGADGNGCKQTILNFLMDQIASTSNVVATHFRGVQ